MCTPSATLTVWAAAWLAGRQAPDDLLEALHAWSSRQHVTAADAVAADHIGLGVAYSDTEPGLTMLLKMLRTTAANNAHTDSVRLLLPVPGDVRGLPAGTDFATEALEAEEAVLIGAPGSQGIGLVPRWDEDDTLCWAVYSTPIPIGGAPELTLGEAEYSMREAVREAAEAMVRLRRTAGNGAGSDPRELVEAELSAYARHRYPDSTPMRARRVLDTADHVAAILTVAQQEPSFAPISAGAARSQEALLRPLWEAIRSARLVAVRAAAGGIA